MTSPNSTQRLEQFFAAHRGDGQPVTTQRLAVYEAILDRRDHPTAEQLYTEVRQQLPQISRMTVHRILGNFVSLGLVAKTCHPGSAARFDPNLEQHHHLVCLDCGRIRDVEDTRLNGLPWPKVDVKDFQIQDYNVHFLGRCAECLEKQPALKSSGVAKPSSAPPTKARQAKVGRTATRRARQS